MLVSPCSKESRVSDVPAFFHNSSPLSAVAVAPGELTLRKSIMLVHLRLKRVYAPDPITSLPRMIAGSYRMGLRSRQARHSTPGILLSELTKLEDMGLIPYEDGSWHEFIFPIPGVLTQAQFNIFRRERPELRFDSEEYREDISA